jgi:hypothetical protein
MGQQRRLIEAALPAPPPVQRHRDDRMERLVAWNCTGEDFAERAGQWPDPCVFQEVNEFPEHTFVAAKRVCGVESAQAPAAELASAIGAERRRIHEGRAAGNAEIIGGKRLGVAQAGRANRDARNLLERLPADAAVVREE